MNIKLTSLFFAIITFSVVGLYSINELIFAEEGDYTIATGFESAIGKNSASKKADPDKEEEEKKEKDDKDQKKFKLGKTPVSRQPATPGVQEIGNSNIDGSGLFGTGVGIGVLFPQGVFDAGDRTDPIGPGCPAGYVFVDYNSDAILDPGECWRGVVIKDGKLGIGSINPLFTLDVTGAARITGDLSVPTINGLVPLFTETDPTVPDSVKDGTDWTEISNIPTDIADGDQVGLLSETDPTVPSSIKDGISWTEISNRPAGLDNGDQIGILSESDPTVAHSVKDGVSWPEISSIPSGFADNVDNTGVLIEADPQVGSNSANIVPKWDGSALVSGNIYNDASGNVGIGTDDPKGVLDISSSTNGFVIPRLTTAVRDALSAVNGMMLYNVDNNRFEGFENGVWVALSGSAGASPTPDPTPAPTPQCATDDGNTVVKLHMEDTGLTDAKGHTVTRGANVTRSSAQKKFGSYSAYFNGPNGSNGILGLGDHANWEFGTGNFTIDFWYHPTGLRDDEAVIDKGYWESGVSNGYALKQVLGRLWFRRTNGRINITHEIATGVVLTANTWQHVAIVRSSGVTTIYVGGVNRGSSSIPDDLGTNGAQLAIGGDSGGAISSASVQGYIDELRISKGVARWTSNFTPPTMPYCD